MSTSSKVWFITGTSAGFGRALAEQVLAAGGRVVATARDPRSLESLVALAPERVHALALDVTKPEQMPGAVAAAMARFGAVDVLVNNAGYSMVGAVEETSDAELRLVMETMFFGAVSLTRDYAKTVGPTRDYAAQSAGKQPGDPVKAARAIVAAVEAGAPSLRLPLGADAVQGIRAKLARVHADVDATEAAATATSFDAA